MIIDIYQTKIDSTLNRLDLEFFSQGISPPLVAYIRIGEGLTRLGEFELSYEFYRAAFDFLSCNIVKRSWWTGEAEHRNIRQIGIQLHISMAGSLVEMGDFNSAVYHVKSALDDCITLNDSYMIGKCYRFLAKIKVETGELKVSKRNITKAEEYHRIPTPRLTREHHSVQGMVGMRSRIFAGLSTFGVSESLLGLATLLDKTNVEINRRTVQKLHVPIEELLQDLVLKAEIQLLLGEYQLAMETSYEALETAEHEDSKFGMAISNEKLARILRVLGDLEEAEAKLRKALEINQSLGTKPAIFNNLFNLVRITLQTRDFSQSQNDIEYLFKLSETMGTPLHRANAHYAAGMVYTAQSQDQKALDHYNSAVKSIGFAYTKQRGIYLSALADAYISTGKLSEGKETLDEAEKLI